MPEAAKPIIDVQLSSPIEEQSITKLFDPLNPTEDGSLIHFKGVDTSVATIVVKVSDADIVLGSSGVLDVKPLCEIDVLGGVTKKVTEMEIAIVPDEGSNIDSTVPVENQDSIKEDEAIDTTEVEADVDIRKTETENSYADIEKIETDDDFQDAKSEVDEPKETAGDEDKNLEEDVVDVAKETDAGTEDTEKDTGTDVVDVAKETDAGTEDTEKDAGTAADLEPAEDEIETDNADSENGKESSETKKDDDVTAESSIDTETPETKDSAESKPELSALIPTCFVHVRVEYNPSTKDQKDELYDLLNKASKRKAMAVDKLRKSAAALNRSKPAVADAPKDGKVVKSGFLNKKAQPKKEMFFIRWYNKTLGPNSLTRQVFPIAKNYILFFGGVALMHFQGQQLALPPPV